ncbi:hypothetical protein ACFL2C_01910 [Patescibacteria group bacterium]
MKGKEEVTPDQIAEFMSSRTPAQMEMLVERGVWPFGVSIDQMKIDINKREEKRLNNSTKGSES